MQEVREAKLLPDVRLGAGPFKSFVCLGIAECKTPRLERVKKLARWMESLCVDCEHEQRGDRRSPTSGN